MPYYGINPLLKRSDINDCGGREWRDTGALVHRYCGQCMLNSLKASCMVQRSAIQDGIHMIQGDETSADKTELSKDE